MIQIIGKGGFAREVESYIKSSTVAQECALFDGECDGISKYLPTIIAIGDGKIRAKLWEQFKQLPFTNYNDGYIYGEVDMGIGNIICPGTILTTDIKLGHHNIFNLSCTIGHDCVIGDFVTMSPGANISGNVTIGNGCYIGTNAVIREKISICDNVIIGAGGVVVKDITEPGVYVGNPVKKIG